MNVKKRILISAFVFTLISLLILFLIPSVVLADGYTFPSTNELNKSKQVPGRIGQDAPYVNQDSVDIGEVTLEFINNSNSLAFFEYRIDGEVLSSGTSHPVVTGDFIYPGVCVDGRADPVCSPGPVFKTFYADEYVEVRLALGGERDWDFDWTRFDVLPTPTKADILQDSGVPGKGLDTAPGLQKEFNPNSQAAEHAGQKK